MTKSAKISGTCNNYQPIIPIRLSASRFDMNGKGGRTFRGLVDTGANDLIITPDTKVKLGHITSTTKIETRAVGEAKPTLLDAYFISAAVDLIRADGTETSVAIDNLRTLVRELSPSYDVLIPMTFLAFFKFEIEQGNGEQPKFTLSSASH